MKRKHKSYSRPKTKFEKTRILEEEKIKNEFGLKNKREIWKAEARIKSFRERAKNLISANLEEQQILFNKLNGQGFKVNSIADVLSLSTKDYLKRRLQTVLVEKKITNTSKMARQLIVHKKVLVDEKVVSIPSFIVPIELENKITLRISKTKVKKKKEVEENLENGEKNEE